MTNDDANVAPKSPLTIAEKIAGTQNRIAQAEKRVGKISDPAHRAMADRKLELARKEIEDLEKVI